MHRAADRSRCPSPSNCTDAGVVDLGDVEPPVGPELEVDDRREVVDARSSRPGSSHSPRVACPARSARRARSPMGTGTRELADVVRAVGTDRDRSRDRVAGECGRSPRRSQVGHREVWIRRRRTSKTAVDPLPCSSIISEALLPAASARSVSAAVQVGRGRTGFDPPRCRRRQDRPPPRTPPYRDQRTPRDRAEMRKTPVWTPPSSHR